MYFDTHAHYNDEAFDEDRQQLIKEVYESGVELIINNGNNTDANLASIGLAKEYPFIYAAIGWHPQDAESFDPIESAEQIRKWCSEPKVRAIGEIGLDYYYDEPEREIQRSVFVRQMELAKELSMPVVIHDRDAHGDCMDIVRQFPDVRGEFHCYSGSVEMAKELISMGWYLGFTGVVTFKNARKALEVAEVCPLDRILIETDCPYLAPVPNRGKRNDSRNLVYVAERLAEIKWITVDEIARITLENGKRFFGIA